mgnify:CR=1 FL=1
MRWAFEDFVADTGTRQLTRRGEPVSMSPRAFDLLLVLLEARPHVVTKTALHSRLWPATFVSDASLSMLVTEVRAAVGDDPRTARVIRTAHRHGYAFRAAATTLPEPEPDSCAPASWLVTPSGHLPLMPGVNVIGRDPAARVRLASPSVSRRHAQIVVTSDITTIEDLGSKNGTFLDGTRVDGTVRLTDGCALRFGSAQVAYRITTLDATWSATRPS